MRPLMQWNDTHIMFAINATRLITVERPAATWPISRAPARRPPTRLASWPAAPAATSPAPEHAPDTAWTSSSTSAATAAPSPSSSASAPRTSATHVTRTFRGSPTCRRRSCRCAQQDQKQHNLKATNVHFT
ncbi:uncharacterized protein LOC113378376 [Ctenocephalides felis]|uniref:uncharacterized protein LOC113378376 n=1 Tax=Ctenocephalides felis TaxID=7515 RepID=UPI000E6E4BC8|nr:uncharacterized protein LOC113378376 [Ctenocephalides felis]